VILGVTGLAGSGKSTLCRFLERYGYRHISADALGHGVLACEEVQKEIQAVFGAEVVRHGEVVRALLAERAFKDREMTKRLNAILHPPIRRRIMGLLEQHVAQGVDTCLEAALLCETGLVAQCDWSIFLDCPFETRLKRVGERGWGEAELKNRDAQQDEQLKADATDIRWKGPNQLENLQRFSLFLDIAFRYERACLSKEKAIWVLQYISQNKEIYVQRSS